MYTLHFWNGNSVKIYQSTRYKKGAAFATRNSKTATAVENGVGSQSGLDIGI